MSREERRARGETIVESSGGGTDGSPTSLTSGTRNDGISEMIKAMGGGGMNGSDWGFTGGNDVDGGFEHSTFA